MPVQALPGALSTAPADPARPRGLRRARQLGPCPPVPKTSLPPAPADVEVLALLTRVRSVRVSQEQLAEGRLYDLRAYKTAAAELAYLRRLAAGGRHGGTVVTSMRQLVAGLAPLHPAWRITGGEGWEDRDRHHRAVRRRLGDLQAMGLLRWRVGVDELGEERRTELELLPVPEILSDELEEAAGRMARWETRYGRELDTGSRTGVRGVRRASAPLSAAERQRRGCAQSRDRAARRRGHAEGSKSNSDPPCGAEATPQNNSFSSEGVDPARNVCKRTGVTRANAPAPLGGSAAVKGGETAGIEDGGSVGGGGLGIDVQALVARVRKRQAEREPVLEAIAAQATGRALEVASWSLGRGWPAGRLREAWVVARFGARAAAEGGSGAAGPLSDEHFGRLRRAVARYERYGEARPDGFPAGGLAALLYLGAAEDCQGCGPRPRTIAYAAGALDQLSRRMRAHATATSEARVHAAARRAWKRRSPASPRPGPLSFQFRSDGPRWPRWLAVGEDGGPVFEGGLPVIDVDLAEAMGACPGSGYYDTVIRDAYLIAGRHVPVTLDGRWAMLMRHRGDIPPARRPDTEPDWTLLELARRTGEPARTWERVPAELRAGLLADLRTTQALTARAELQAFHERLGQRDKVTER
jgi:hypothetical protein